jgi:hypothetical protein
MFPYVGIEFAVYETLKNMVEAHRQRPNASTAAGKRNSEAAPPPLSTMALLLVGAVAGACAQVPY